MATALEQLYERDFYAWTKDQAAAFRKLAAERWNGPLDLERLAQEIEDVGSDRRDAVLSQVERLMLHLLKLEHSPSDRHRRSWLLSVADARLALRRKLTATLRAAVEDELDASYRHARRHAVAAMIEYGERDAARELPEACPYTLDQLTDEAWLPKSRHGIVDEEL
jgi:DNA-binding PucR family transcriptional regulator